jgi:hypothetical protein
MNKLPLVCCAFAPAQEPMKADTVCFNCGHDYAAHVASNAEKAGLKVEDMLDKGPLAGHYFVKEEIVICAKCGGNLTHACKILGDANLVMLHHAYKHAEQRINETTAAFWRHQEQIKDPTDKRNMALQFSIFFGAVSELVNMVEASNGKLFPAKMDPHQGVVG